MLCIIAVAGEVPAKALDLIFMAMPGSVWHRLDAGCALEDNQKNHFKVCLQQLGSLREGEPQGWVSRLLHWRGVVVVHGALRTCGGGGDDSNRTVRQEGAASRFEYGIAGAPGRRACPGWRRGRRRLRRNAQRRAQAHEGALGEARIVGEWRSWSAKSKNTTDL